MRLVLVKKANAYVDGGFLVKALTQALHGRQISAQTVVSAVESCLEGGEVLDTLYFYDRSWPGTRPTHPQGSPARYSGLLSVAADPPLLRDLAACSLVRVRSERRNQGAWKLAPGTIRRAVEDAALGNAYELGPNDLTPDLQHPRVDMALGLDVASACHLALTDLALFVTEDPNWETVIHYARREGMPTLLSALPGRRLPSELRLIPGRARVLGCPSPTQQPQLRRPHLA